MPAPRILPLGFIDRTTSDGAVILLTKPSDSPNLRPETAVTLTSQSTGPTNATARVRGIITAVGYATATFKVVETQRPSNCPENEAILRKGTPVFAALPDSFVPDPARTLSRAQQDSLRRLAAQYRKITTRDRPPPSHHGNRPETALNQTRSRSRTFRYSGPSNLANTASAALPEDVRVVNLQNSRRIPQ